MPRKRKETHGVPQSPDLFRSTRTRGSRKGTETKTVILKTLADTNILSTSSFRYEDPGYGLKSTQEIPLDWEKFENHTFFNSAQSKVNVAFHKIINEYPFDGTRKQVEAFEDSLTGYEKYILDIFPKNNGYLIFSGTTSIENPGGGYSAGLGTSISVVDSAGSQFPDLSKDRSGKPVINFGESPFSIEMMIYIPAIENDNQIICQKRHTESRCITLALSKSISTRNIPLIFSLSSGSARIIASASIEKGVFSHICATYDKGSTNNLNLYLSQTLVATSSTSYDFESLSFSDSNFIIGSGSMFLGAPTSKHLAGSTSMQFIPAVTFSGSLDELRLFHSTRNTDDQKRYEKRIIYPDNDDLKLYFRFNEPSGSYDGNNVVLDSSGNSLNSIISNYSEALRNTGSSGQPLNPISGERPDRSPVLFPDFIPIKNLNARLLLSASDYDIINPNLVTRLFPSHYLLEGQDYQGFATEEGNIAKAISGNSIPGSAKLGSAQNLTAFMLIWAKFYDEIKIFIDHLSNVLHVSYDDEDSVARKLLPFVAQYYGLELPSIFGDAPIEQFIRGEDIEDAYETSLNSLQFVQTEMWKRILLNYNDVRVSKGTVHSIKSLIRSAGINPDNLMTIREFGGPTKRSLTGRRETKVEVASSLDFSGSYASVDPGSLNSHGFSSKFPHIVSNFLSGTRVEVGFPNAEQFIHASASMNVKDMAGFNDGETLIVTDDNNKSVTFEFDDDSSSSVQGAVIIPIPTVGGVAAQAEKIVQKVTGSFSGSIDGFAVGGGSGILTLKNKSNKRKNLGNILITSTIGSSHLTIDGFKGGKGFILQDTSEYGIHGISTDPSDGLFTSGSFTYEATYQFPLKDYIKYELNQSLVRLHVSCSNTGSKSELSKGVHYANLLLVSGTENSLTSSGSTLRLYMRPGNTSNTHIDPLLRLELTGVNIFDGGLWNVSFGRERSDQKRVEDSGRYITEPISFVGSSSYFLRAARQSYGSVESIYVTSSFFKEDAGGITGPRNILQVIDSTYNPSGSTIVIGSQSMANVSSDGSNGSFGPAYNRFLIDPNLDTSPGGVSGDRVLANKTNFAGQISQARFWSKALEIDEWKEHVRNFKSLGVNNPLVNFNFEKAATGSFQRLRVDASTDQYSTESNSLGDISIFDFSQNEIYMSGAGFEPSSQVIKPETFYYSHLSPKFDLSQASNKVRVRSLNSPELLDEYKYASIAPVYDVLKIEEPDDDTRFAIEFSSVKALDEDIMNMFSDLVFFDNALGKVNLLFDDIYPDLDQARKIYFHRVTEKLNYQIFFEMYRWFNTSLGDLIEQLIPRKTKFLGINFIIESHVLERNRFRYLFDEIYLKALARDTSRGNLLLSQIVGNLQKY
jgi:hypothetical protein